MGKWLPYATIVLLILVLLSLIGREPEVREVIVERRVEIPVVEQVFDTVPIPVPGPERVLRDTIVLPGDTIAVPVNVRLYNQIFEDSIQVVDVFSKVAGHLLEQSIAYETKPREVVVRDTMYIYPRPKGYLSALAGVGMPLLNTDQSGPTVFQGGLMYTSAKGGSWSVTGDTQGNVFLTKSFKLRWGR